MMRKTYHNSRTTKWIMFLFEFDLVFINQKSIKGQVIIDQLAVAPLESSSPLQISLLDENIFKIDEVEEHVDTQEDFDITMYFDGSRCEQGGGAKVIFFTLQGVPIPYSFKLDFLCTNNNVEYEALILGLKVAIELKFEHLLIYGDSQLVVNQILGTYQCHNELLKVY